MREIKFRVWYKQTQKMHAVKKMGFSEGELCYVEDEDSDSQPPYILFSDDWALMQYTGLKDKNGNEIYEGDIVQIKDHAFQGAIDIDGNYEVFYNDYMELCCGSLILFKQRPYITVVGNIYENPELLEGKENE